jgi:SAM-dependent methyltransferase
MNRAHIDRLVDDEYLAACARGWAVVRGLAPSILDEIDGAPGVAPDEHRAYCIRWLRQAATIGSDQDAQAPAEAMAPTLDLLKHAAAEYPSFLRGATSGPAILLAGDGLRLWYDYFQSSNGLYRPLNAAAVHTVLGLLREGRGSRILEVGAGTGGATSHLLACWPDDLAADVEYTVTDTSPRLLRATRERVADDAPAEASLDFRRFDFDLPASQQRLAPQSFDIVFAVNAIHNAADLASTLRELRSLLRPNGALVLSESICGSGDLVHQEFILNLLPLPADAYPRMSRFHSKSDWLRIFTDAAVLCDVQVNSLGPELVMTAVVTPGEPR